MNRDRGVPAWATWVSAISAALLATSAALADETTQRAAPIASGESRDDIAGLLDRDAARELLELMRNLSLTGRLSSPLYLEQHLPHQRPPRGNASSDELERLEQGVVARARGLEPVRCKTTISAGSSADLDGDGVAGSLDARVECGLQSDTRRGEFSARLRERDSSDSDWRSDFSQQLELRFEVRPIGAARDNPLVGREVTETHRSVEVRRVDGDAGFPRFQIDKTDRFRGEWRGAPGEIVREDGLAYELQALVQPESSRRGRAVDYAIDGAIESLSGTLRLGILEPETGASQERSFRVDASNLRYRARRSGDKRCFFQTPYDGTVSLSDSAGNRLDLLFDWESCRRRAAYNGEALE